MKLFNVLPLALTTLLAACASTAPEKTEPTVPELNDTLPKLTLQSVLPQVAANEHCNPAMDSDLLYGRIDGEKLQALAKTLINFRQYDDAFICGPSSMMDEAEAALKALGMSEKSIHLERFNTPGTAVKRTVNVQADEPELDEV